MAESTSGRLSSRAFLAAAAAAACFGSAPGLAQETGKPDDVERRLEDVERRNRELEARLDEIDGGAETEEGAGDAVEHLGLGLNIKRGPIRATLQLFGDVNFKYDNPARADRSNSAFGFGQINAFFTSQIGDNFQVLSETVIKTRESKTSDDLVFDQERLFGSWTLSDALYAKLGLEHSPVSRWNRVYHHGRWLETTIDRPFLARFEGTGGVFPMHQAGLELGGTLGCDLGRLEYLGVVSNGRGETVTRVQKVSDVNDSKALDFGIGLLPSSVEGLRVGGNAHFEEIPSDDGNPARSGSIGEFIPSGSAEYRSYPIEVISEFAYVDHDDRVSDMTFGHHSGYVQIGYHEGDLTPYTRFDYRQMERGDPFYSAVDRDLDRWEQIVGVRYDILSNVALKLEVGIGRAELRSDSGDIRRNTVVLAGFQLSWVF